MWGDTQSTLGFVTGSDTFVFVGAFANDKVFDFHEGEDKIEFQVAGLKRFGDLVIEPSGSDSIIRVSATDTVTLVGIDPLTLTASDFVFS